MKKIWVLLGAVAISIIIIVAIIPSMQNPEIYKKTPAEYTTPFHTDPGLYVKSDLNSSESSFFLMQDMLDITGPLTLNIRITDPESAAEDLARYRGMLGSMDKLIVKIEMSQSDLEDYLATHKDNEKILSDLLNETQDLDRLKELEIQFTDQENQGSYVSVIYQESAIRNRISGLYNRYHANSEAVNTTATKYGLNTTEYEGSIKNFAAIVEKETATQVVLDMQVTDVKKSIANQTKDSLTMEIFPAQARYGDLITIRGLLKSTKMRGQNITIDIDNRDTAEIRTGFGGEYEFHYLINKITPGRHAVYVSSGIIFSDTGSFTVIPVNSVTTLQVPATSDKPSVNITGSVYTSGGVPVMDAPVTIAWGLTSKRTNKTEVTTGVDGQYHTRIAFPHGNYTIQAVFQGSGYPVNPSKSQVLTISVDYPDTYQEKLKQEPFSFFSIVVLGGALVLSSGAAVLYLRRRRARSFVSSARIETPQEDTNATGLWQEVLIPKNTEPETNEIPQRSIHDGLEQKIPQLGFREAAYDIYWKIVSLLFDKTTFSAARSLTTREVVKSCQGKPYYKPLRNFIAVYERVRYGPDPLTEEDKVRFMDESGELVAKIRGDEHP